MERSIDFNQLRVQIRDAARLVFSAVQIAHAAEDFYAFALYTDAGALTVCAAANTEQALARKVNHRNETDPAELNYLRWAIAEWEYERSGADRFHPLCEQLRACRLAGHSSQNVSDFNRQLLRQ